VEPDLNALQQRLQHQFQNPRLLQRAVTHRSFSADHNERLEFLGDSVLNLAVARLLYDALSTLPEGDLSRVRAHLVKQDTLHKLAVTLGLPDMLHLGEGEAKSGGQKRPSILADALEAIIGAVYLDSSFDTALKLVERLFADAQINPQMPPVAKDPKTELQELLQGRKMKLPNYTVVNIMGAAHKQTFEVACEVVELKATEHGVGPSRRAGEQAAAAAMLTALTRSGRA
jgi:ribonuclease III